MKLIRSSKEFPSEFFAKSVKIGFVPTMGCLHQGHVSLIQKAKENTEITICSIFVNPTQFNNPEDFNKYPSTLDADIDILVEQKCDYLYLPSIAEIYPPNFQKKIYPLGYLETIWEGEHRPGHFQGVCQVMERLLEMVPNTDLWLGQKDLQQCLVIKRLLEIQNNTAIQVHFGPTVREASGLALSSRNVRLSGQGKQKASLLYKSLVNMRDHFQSTDLSLLEKMAKEKLLMEGFEKVDYLAMVETENLVKADTYYLERYYSVIAAAWLEGVRLIDNLKLN